MRSICTCQILYNIHMYEINNSIENFKKKLENAIEWDDLWVAEICSHKSQLKVFTWTLIFFVKFSHRFSFLIIS